MIESKKDILWRVYALYLGMCLFAVAIIFQLFKVQYVEGDAWRAKAKALTTEYFTIDALRGNIFAEDGALLATSLPIYEVRMDMMADAITNKIFNRDIDSLSICLAQLFPTKTKEVYKKELKKARQHKERYHLIRRGVRYTELKQMKRFPLYRLGKYKGGLICLQQNKREQPFKNLAVRTIGYDRAGQPVGIEGAYNNYLKGIQGKRLMQKIAGGVWMPINDENEIEPKDGCDIITTLDVNIQDVAQQSLKTQLLKYKADHGCVVLMEVATGEIKAIANYTKSDTATYVEQYNYALGEALEPGSTFKLASYMAAIDDGYISINDTIDAEGGRKKFYDRIVRDSHEGLGRTSVKHAFELSSNVAIAKIIQKHYGKYPKRFTDKIYSMGLNKSLGLSLPGEGVPRIKNPKDKDWYGTTLPYMAHGYEIRLTPLQTLAFYNAVANNGKKVKPLFVKEIKRYGATVKKYDPVVLNKSICSPKTLKQLRSMLEGVVLNGTATNLKTNYLKIAGKTGTAVMARNNRGYGNQAGDEGGKIYQASFVGYFPAEDPKYSCIVVVNNPSGRAYTGNVVAGTVFKEIADKVYATNLYMQKEIEKDTLPAEEFIPNVKSGSSVDMVTVFKKMVIPTTVAEMNSDWVSVSTQKNKMVAKATIVKDNTLPNVVGMGARDAMYLLESKGYSVLMIGKGVVKKQTLIPIDKFLKEKKVIIELV